MAEYKEFAQQYAQQYSFEKGLKMFKERGEEAAMTELDQLHRRVCFTPILVKELTAEEKCKAQLALMLLSKSPAAKSKPEMYTTAKTHVIGSLKRTRLVLLL